ncbi:MAG: electron transport complex protein RnfA, partial [Oscillospiraceae bacterium]|nr:electron transport complex protein RnfA [Candidatus Equicaccousia limihippi]
MLKVVAIILAGILTNNMVLSKFLGICPFLGVSKKYNTAFAMGVAVTLVMLVATAVTYPLYTLVLLPLKIEYLQTIAFILVIAALVQLIEILLKRFLPPIYKALGIYLPLITTNCAVLGITLLNFTNTQITSFGLAICNALGAGLGFLLAMMIFAGIRTRIEKSNIPA